MNNSSQKLLFPYQFKYIGLVFLITGIVLGIIRFYYGIKPTIFDLKVFAIYSKYIETIVFSPITNHFSEEIAGILILIGLVLIAFSKEKKETEHLNDIRLYSIILSIYINAIVILISLLFIFGLGFVNVLIINMYLLLVVYIIIFQFSRIRSNYGNKHQT